MRHEYPSDDSVSEIQLSVIHNGFIVTLHTFAGRKTFAVQAHGNNDDALEEALDIVRSAFQVMRQ